ncbi:MAG: radical SAM family heme chaperone HemW [Desulfovibrionaceae bacterium]|nr:radical SAM family heme chaperone HemW [Desulfovibrionaceae bacterium]
MLIYIHVPFCKSKCNYCAFNSWVAAEGEIQRYVAAVLAEVSAWGERLGKRNVSTVFIGGGTPSLLPVAAIWRLLASLPKYFPIAPNAEISMEANPQSGQSAQYYSDLLRAGINRLSLGVQSLDDRMLHLMNRPHTVADAFRAMFQAREAGFKNINLDLMWGLPGQRLRNWKAELREVIGQLRPEHISAYGLTLEEGTPFQTWHDAERISFSDEKELGHMFLDGAEILEEAGYLQYEISNFAKIGYQCRHNLGYWEGEDYLGLGPGAVSTLDGYRLTNPRHMKEYLKMLEQKQTPGIAYGEAEKLTPQTKLMERIMLSLRTQKGFSAQAYRELTGNNFFDEHKAIIAALHSRGLIRIRDGNMALTRSGMLVSNTIISNLFSRLPRLEGLRGRELSENGGKPVASSLRV